MNHLFFVLFSFSMLPLLGQGQKTVTAPLYSFEGHTEAVKSLAVSPTGALLISGSLDKTIKFWNTATSANDASFRFTESVGNVAISPDDAFFAYTPVFWSKDAKPQKPGSVSKTLDKSEVHTLSTETALMQSVCFSRNGKYIATGDRLGNVRIIDAHTYKELYHFHEKNNFISALSFLGENDQYLAIGGDKSLRVWEYLTPTPTSVGSHIGGAQVNALAVSPDNKLIAVVGDGNKVEVFDALLGKKHKMPELPYEPFAGAVQELKSIAYSPNGKFLAAAGLDGIVYVWQVQSGTLSAQFKGHIGTVWSLVFSPDNRYLYSAGADKSIKMWDICDYTFAKRALPIVSWEKFPKEMITDSLRKTLQFSVHSFYPLTDIAFFQNGKRLAAEFNDNNKLKRIYNLTFPLEVKENKLRIEAANEAGLSTSDERTLIFTPPMPKVTWVSLNDNNSISKSESVNAQFCISSPVPLQEVKMYLNGAAIPNEELIQVPGNGAGCHFMASARLKLRPKSNTVTLMVNNGATAWGQSDERTVTYTPPAPTITWVSPDSNYMTITDTTQKTVGVKLCITSVMPIVGYQMLNETADSRGLEVKKVKKAAQVTNEAIAKGSCDNQYIATIPLHANENILSLKVFTEYDTTYSSKKTIRYKVPKDSTKTWEGTYYAVLIGENNYQDMGIEDLQNPAKDADSLANVLTSLYSFEPQNVFVLKDATKVQIQKQLSSLTKKINPDDKLLIFYAGHGIEKNKVGFFLPVDAERGDFTTWLSSDELLSILKQMNSQHTLLIADACYSGSFLQREVTENEAKQICEILESKVSRRAITSGASESVPDQSVFVKYLLKSLHTESNPCISSSELFSKFRNIVTLNSPSNQKPQEGALQQVGHEGGDFIFHKK